MVTKDHLAAEQLVWFVLQWLFEDFVIPLLRSCFHPEHAPPQENENDAPEALQLQEEQEDDPQ
jgi:hypothetical protein